MPPLKHADLKILATQTLENVAELISLRFNMFIANAPDSETKERYVRSVTLGFNKLTAEISEFNDLIDSFDTKNMREIQRALPRKANEVSEAVNTVKKRITNVARPEGYNDTQWLADELDTLANYITRIGNCTYSIPAIGNADNREFLRSVVGETIGLLAKHAELQEQHP